MSRLGHRVGIDRDTCGGEVDVRMWLGSVILVGVLLPGTALAKKVRFSHRPLEVSEKITVSTTMDLDMKMILSRGPETEEQFFEAHDEAVIGFDIQKVQGHSIEVFGMVFEQKTERKTDPSLGEPVERTHPLDGRQFLVTPGEVLEVVPDPGEDFMGDFRAEVGTLRRIVLPFEMVFGRSFVVGERIEGYQEVLLGGISEGEIQSSTVTMNGVRKADGKKLAVLGLVATVRSGGDQGSPGMTAKITGELLVDTKTSRLHHFDITGPVVMVMESPRASLDGNGTMTVSVDFDFDAK